MVLKLKPEQQKVLELAARSGMNPEEVLDQAFAVIQEQHRNEAWMLEERDAVSAHIAEGFTQAERGELISPEQAVRTLQERRAKRRIA